MQAQEAGSKQTLTQAFLSLKQQGIDTNALFKQIGDVCAKTIAAF
jgi:hypothetical protein